MNAEKRPMPTEVRVVTVHPSGAVTHGDYTPGRVCAELPSCNADQHTAQCPKEGPSDPPNPWAVALDAVWSELTREQIDNLPDGVADLCRATHEALHHLPGWDDPHHFADPPAKADQRAPDSDGGPALGSAGGVNDDG